VDVDVEWKKQLTSHPFLLVLILILLLLLLLLLQLHYCCCCLMLILFFFSFLFFLRCPVAPLDVKHPTSHPMPDVLPKENPFISLAGYCDGIPPISDAERVSKRITAAKELVTLGFSAYVTEPGPSMKYFVNVAWKLSERPFLLVLRADQSFFFISPSKPPSNLNTSSPFLTLFLEQ